MATETSPETTADDAEHEYLFAGWVYQVPGFLLILSGFGALVAMSVL